jgi:hexokinase
MLCPPSSWPTLAISHCLPSSLIRLPSPQGPPGNGEPRGAFKDSNCQLSFTFSFACRQTSPREGTPMSWDKGWVAPSGVRKIRRLAMSIGSRAAVLAGASLGDLVIQSGRLETSFRSLPVTSSEGLMWNYFCSMTMAAQKAKEALGLSSYIKNHSRQSHHS